MESILAKDLMNTDVLIVSEDLDLRALVELFIERKVRSAPVINEEGRCVGVITSNEIYKSLPFDVQGTFVDSDRGDYYFDTNSECKYGVLESLLPFLSSIPIKEVMIPLVLMVQEHTPLDNLKHMMINDSLQRVIVTRNGSGKILGVVKLQDIKRWERINRLGQKTSIKKPLLGV